MRRCRLRSRPDAVAAEFGERGGVGERAYADGRSYDAAGGRPRGGGEGEPYGVAEGRPAARTAALDPRRESVSERAPQPDAVFDQAEPKAEVAGVEVPVAEGLAAEVPGAEVPGGKVPGAEVPAAEPAEAAAQATANVRDAIPRRRTPRRNTQLGTRDAERMIDLRTKGRTYREIAEEVGVSRSTVGKRMREFTETGSIPIVKAR